MKSALLMATAAVAVLSLAACNKPNAADTTATTSTTATTAADAGTTNSTVNAAQDATASVVGAASSATVGQTKAGYVSGAAMADMYEVAAGKIAAERAKSADVKAFGKMMVKDHTATTAEMVPLATAAGETPPPALDDRRKGMLDNLKAAGPADFDKVYIDQQVAAHEEALTLHQGYADKGDDAGLKAFAAKTAPKVQMHLDKAKALQASMTK